MQVPFPARSISFFYDDDGVATRSCAGKCKARALTYQNERSECRRWATLKSEIGLFVCMYVCMHVFVYPSSAHSFGPIGMKLSEHYESIEIH